MKSWTSLILIFFFFASQAWSQVSSKDVLEEKVYQEFRQIISSPEKHEMKTMLGFNQFEQSLFVDALWDSLDEGQPEALEVLESVEPFYYGPYERLRIGILRLKYQRQSALSESLVSELLGLLRGPQVEKKIIYTLAAYEEELSLAGHHELVELAKAHSEFYDIAQIEDQRKDISEDLVTDLFHNSPDVTTYMNGEYVKSVKLFMFCRPNRLYPCLMVMRNVHGEVVRKDDGTIWAQPGLASSAQGLPSYVRNGNTPSGIYTIDSVMPVADQQLSFGKFRRIIINFVSKSKSEVLTKSLLPESHHNKDWWRAAVVARDIGRNLLRIHGTGKKNTDPNTPYYPFMRTNGCIAQRENTYGKITYKDQRKLLDQIMESMDLRPIYDNEVKVKGILYLMEIEDVNAPVTIEDIKQLGIE